MLTSKLAWISSGPTTKVRTRINLLLDETFFGITLEYKEKLHEQIFDFIYYSKGGFAYSDVYKMPVSIRTMYMGKLAKILEEKAEAMKKANRKNRR